MKRGIKRVGMNLRRKKTGQTFQKKKKITEKFQKNYRKMSEGVGNADCEIL